MATARPWQPDDDQVLVGTAIYSCDACGLNSTPARRGRIKARLVPTALRSLGSCARDGPLPLTRSGD